MSKIVCLGKYFKETAILAPYVLMIRYLPILTIMLWPVTIGCALLFFSPVLTFPTNEIFAIMGAYAVALSLLLAVIAIPGKDRMSASFFGFPFIPAAITISVFLYTSFFVVKSPALLILFGLPDVVILGAGPIAFIYLTKMGRDGILLLSWAVFFSMLLYLPVLLGHEFVRGNDPDFDWTMEILPFRVIRVYSMLLVVAIAAGLGLWVHRLNEQKGPQAWLLLGLFLMWTALFWSGSRASVLSIGISLILIAIWVGPLGAKLLRASALTSVPALLVSVFIPIPNGSFGFLQRFFNTGKYDAGRDPFSAMTSSRTDIWLEAIGFIGDRPLFGYGAAQYAALSENSRVISTHSFIIDALLDFGLIGGTALLILVWGGYLLILKRTYHKLDTVLVAPLLMLSVMLFQSFIDPVLSLPTSILYTCLMFCALIVGLQKKA